MRRVLLTFGSILLAAGCGSETIVPETGAAGIPLSISGNQTPNATGANAASNTTISQYSDSVRQLLQKANAGVVAGNHAIAIEAISQAISLAPDDASLFRIRADVYVLHGENANARVDFSMAIRLAPNDADYYNYRGYFLMSQRLTKEAVADFEKAVQLRPCSCSGPQQSRPDQPDQRRLQICRGRFFKSDRWRSSVRRRME
jgi:Tfp pilus assembly protein PilF